MPHSPKAPIPAKPKGKPGPKPKQPTPSPLAEHQPMSISTELSVEARPFLLFHPRHPDAFLTFDPSRTTGILHAWITPPNTVNPQPLAINRGSMEYVETGITLVPQEGYHLLIVLHPNLRGFALAQYATDGSWIGLQNVQSHIVIGHGDPIAAFCLIRDTVFVVQADMPGDAATRNLEISPNEEKHDES